MKMNYKYSASDFVIKLTPEDKNATTYNSNSEIVNLEINNVRNGSQANMFDETLQKLWNDADEKKLFRYPFKQIPYKIISDEFQFILQLNPERASKRREPQEIKNVNQAFNSDEFNFNKAKPEETIMNLSNISTTDNNKKEEESHCSVLINVSPFEYCSVLLVPFPEQNQPQCITREGLKSALEILFISRSSDLRVGFNSLCGFASVNHHHYHAYYLKHRLYIEYAELKHLAGPCFEFNDVKYPSPGFIFLLSDFKHLDNFLDSCFQLISHLQNNNIAHNLYITRGSSTNIENEFNCIRLFVWGRTSSYGAKACDAFNPALCELAGHFPIKNEKSYSTMTEEYIINELEGICRSTFTSLKSQIVNLLWKDNESFVSH